MENHHVQWENYGKSPFLMGKLWKDPPCLSENVVYPIVPNGFADQTIPFLNGYFIGNINPTFSDKPIFQATFDCRRVMFSAELCAELCVELSDLVLAHLFRGLIG